MPNRSSGGFLRDDTGALVVAGQGGFELGYAESITAFVVTASLQDVPGMQIAVTVGSRPFYIEGQAVCQYALGTATAGAPARIRLDVVDTSNSAVVARGTAKFALPTSTNAHDYCYFKRRISLPAGTQKTYKLQAIADVLPTGANPSLQVDGGNDPIWLAAFEA